MPGATIVESLNLLRYLFLYFCIFYVALSFAHLLHVIFYIESYPPTLLYICYIGTFCCCYTTLLLFPYLYSPVYALHLLIPVVDDLRCALHYWFCCLLPLFLYYGCCCCLLYIRCVLHFYFPHSAVVVYLHCSHFAACPTGACLLRTLLVGIGWIFAFCCCLLWW